MQFVYNGTMECVCDVNIFREPALLWGIPESGSPVRVNVTREQPSVKEKVHEENIRGRVIRE